MKNFIRSLAALAFVLTAQNAFAQGFTLPDGSVLQGHVKAAPQPGAVPPVAVGCTIDAQSTDFAGKCVTSSTSGSITFNRTFAVAPFCLITDATSVSATSMPIYTVSATAITLSTVITAHTLFYLCMGTLSSS